MTLPFHCDIAFLEHPFEGLCLHPLALPAPETSTTFVSNAAGWDALPDDLRELLRDRRGLHRFQDQHLLPGDSPELATWHPAMRIHPRTGREMLFLTENHVQRIEGFDAAQSARLLERIFAVIYAPERRYEHVWRAGDLLIRDNFALQHARTRSADPEAGARIMQRVALGPFSFTEQVEKLRSAA